MHGTDPTEQRPTVYLIAGPNGAGKTTFATEFLPDFVKCRQFLNADLIAAGLSPFAPETQNVRAGRLQLIRIRELANAGEDFGFETTLAGRTYLPRLRKLRTDGYRVAMFFLWLPTVQMAIERVANRVREGGHNVPEADIRRRHRNGLRNLMRDFLPMADSWWIFDASCLPPVLLANQDHGKMVVHDECRFDELKRQAHGHDNATGQ